MLREANEGQKDLETANWVRRHAWMTASFALFECSLRAVQSK
jgi:hypothetical protein